MMLLGRTRCFRPFPIWHFGFSTWFWAISWTVPKVEVGSLRLVSVNWPTLSVRVFGEIQFDDSNSIQGSVLSLIWFWIPMPAYSWEIGLIDDWIWWFQLRCFRRCASSEWACPDAIGTWLWRWWRWAPCSWPECFPDSTAITLTSPRITRAPLWPFATHAPPSRDSSSLSLLGRWLMLT